MHPRLRPDQFRHPLPEISVSIILQSLAQLEAAYGHDKAVTILSNCDHLLYLGGQELATARYISVKANKSVHTILNMPLNHAWLFTRGGAPKEVGEIPPGGPSPVSLGTAVKAESGVP